MQHKMKAKIGLLPMYLELYDEVLPEVREEFTPFIKRLQEELESRSINVILANICRLANEFEEAIHRFENEDVDCIVTLHLAYSPSLECIDALSNTSLPLLVFDTTKDNRFDSASLIMSNHGIHGVQDMCNLLIRRGKDFFIEVGHIDSSEVLDKIEVRITGARLAKIFRAGRIGQVGGWFKGMGDFQVTSDVMAHKLGFEVVRSTAAEFEPLLPRKDAPEVLAEMAKDHERFDLSEVSETAHNASVVAGLALRRWIEKENLLGFTINFLSISRDAGLSQMPFLEISKAMSRGVGYAGEGDVLTAALTGTVSRVLGNASFSEMFCPDWSTDTIFLSHMGEMNLSLVEDRVVLIEKPWSFTDADSPVSPSGCFKEGEAVLINLAPGKNDTFSLIVSPVMMVRELYEHAMEGIVRGWFKPRSSIIDFLKQYSLSGGTHHLVIAYGQPVEELKTFAEIMKWNMVVIK